jgi:ADP-ribose pyrophosphatase
MISIKLKETMSKGFLSVLKVVFSQTKFNGEVLESVVREVLYRKTPVVFLTLLDKNTHELLLVKQVRVGAFIDDKSNPFTIEPIAGMVDKGEEPIIAAVREAKEETGADISAGDLKLIKSCYLSPGITNEYGYFYFAEFDSTKYKTGNFGEVSEAEDIKTMLVKVEEMDNLTDHFSVATLISQQIAKEALRY